MVRRTSWFRACRIVMAANRCGSGILFRMLVKMDEGEGKRRARRGEKEMEVGNDASGGHWSASMGHQGRRGFVRDFRER